MTTKSERSEAAAKMGSSKSAAKAEAARANGAKGGRPRLYLTVEEVQAELERVGASTSKFWSHAAGGDRTPILKADFERLIEESMEEA